jgi:uncharacterized membrane protein YphA (DoxX/SURF4 family)
MVKMLFRALVYALGALFIVVGMEKVLSPSHMQSYLTSSLGFSESSSRVLSAVVPWLELYCGVGLLVQQWRPAASVILLLLSAIFLSIHVGDIIRGNAGTCSCMGGTLTNAYGLAAVCVLAMVICASVVAQHFTAAKVEARDNLTASGGVSRP